MPLILFSPQPKLHLVLMTVGFNASEKARVLPGWAAAWPCETAPCSHHPEEAALAGECAAPGTGSCKVKVPGTSRSKASKASRTSLQDGKGQVGKLRTRADSSKSIN